MWRKRNNKGTRHRKERRRRNIPEAYRRVLERATGEEKAQAAAWVEEHGQVATPRAIAAELQWRAAFAEWQAEVQRDVDKIGRRAAKLVALALAARGIAPTWVELGQGLGWRFKSQANWAIPFLVEQGWLVSGLEPRSLRPGPKLRGR